MTAIVLNMFSVFRLYTLYFALVSANLLLASCDSDSNSGENPDSLFDSKIITAEHYYFYSSENDIYAIDPDSPNTPILIASDVVAPYLIHYRLRLYDDDVIEIPIYPALIYAKNGKIWGVNALKYSGFRRAQLSNEQNAYIICRTNSIMANDLADLGYEYTLPGENGICESYYEESDDITKFVSLSMDSKSEPIRVLRGEPDFYVNAIVHFDDFDTNGNYNGFLGLLVQEGDQLVWYERYDDLDTRQVIASGLNSIWFRGITRNNSAYLILNNELKLFSPFTLSLSDTLFTFQSSYNNEVVINSNFETATVFDVSGIFQIDVNSEPSSTRIYSPSPDISALDIEYVSTSAGAIQFAIITDTDRIYSSMALDGSNVIEWYREPSGNYNQRYELEDGFHVFFDTINVTVTFASIDGQYKHILNNAFLVNELATYNFRSEINDNSHYIKMLLIGTFNSNGTLDLTTYGLDGKPISNLGRFDTSTSSPFWRFPLVSNNKFIVTLPSTSGEDVFFADLHKDNSLTQVTDNEIEELIHWPVIRYSF